ncbi:MAG TPA: hypothetical protein VLA16_05300 [Ideonella sp.]|nr:hypothetical protein [Ideonella sp.]
MPLPFRAHAARLAALALLPAACQAATPATTAPASSPVAVQALAQADSAMLQGDARAALAALAGVAAREFRGKDASERACLIERFDRATPPTLSTPVHDAFTGQLIEIYRAYWWRALRAPGEREAEDAGLLQRLRSLLGGSASEAPDFDALAPALTARLQAAGYHALPAGRTPPLQELMIWRQQDSRDVTVLLPESVQPVRLVLLDDFVERGWSHYARCGHGSSAGWATPEGLYAVRPAYGDLEGERFRVSLLGHEAQHFADYLRFPGLASWELEYRAKLTELALAETTQDHLLSRFGAAQSDDLDSPHTYANRRVLRALAERLPQGVAQAGVAALQAAAKAALLDDSARRIAAQARAAAP